MQTSRCSARRVALELFAAHNQLVGGTARGSGQKPFVFGGAGSADRPAQAKK